MKTILLPIYNGIRARNFFRSSTYTILAGDPNIRLVIVAPPSKMEFYRSEFREPNVIFEPYEIISEPWFGKLLAEIAFNLLNTETIRYKQRLEYLRYRIWWRFAVKRIINRLFSPLPIFRPVIRWMDGFVALDPGVVALIKKYKPDMVIVPDIVFPPDRIFLRAAKRARIFVLGMVRSWDNLTSKGVIQLLPDKLLIYTTAMKQEAIKYAGVPERDLIITGIPQYDAFFEPRRTTREEFLTKLGIDPKKRIILCAPFFDTYTGSAIAIVKALTDAIASGRLPNDVHIIVRYRPATPDIVDNEFPPHPNVTVTKPCSRYFEVRNMQSPTKDWEFTQEDLELLLNSLYFSDVVINTISTLSIDAAIFDKPVIVVRFDADPNTPAKHSVNLVIQHDHYKSIEGSGGVRRVWNMDELLEGVRAYLENPKLDTEGRKRIREEQVEIMDGHAGERIAEYIKTQLKIL